MKVNRLIWVRRIFQAFFLCLFVYLLFSTRLPQDVYLDYSLTFADAPDVRLEQPVTFFWQINPLAWITTVLATHQWVAGFAWAIGLLALTLLIGRFFCGFICPLGTLHHMASSIKPALKGSALAEANRQKPDRMIKYFLLTVICVAAFIGLNLSGLLDPISLLFRSLALAVFPALGNALNGFFEILARSDIKILNLLSYSSEVLVAPLFGYETIAFQTGWFIGILFLLILFLNRIRPRFWCRVLCPLGALLGICSKYSLLRLEKVDEKCTHCGICTRNCQGAASCEPGTAWQSPECLLCLNCQELCPEDALAFKLNRPLPMRGPARFDSGRRVVLTGLMVGVSIPFLGKLDGITQRSPSPQLIRPPGSLPENEFLERCQRCGLCMKVCPTNAIHPAFTEAGMAGFWTPSLIMTLGYCEYTCTLCGSVCPTGAIADITSEVKTKTPIRIGSAYIDRGRCIPWSGNGSCIMCEEVCPTSPKAIHLKDDFVINSEKEMAAVKLPYINLKQCVGCGICETKCPVRGKPAIRVISAGETRDPDNQILL